MAALFTVLLGFSAAILVYFLYDLGRQDFLRETEAAIDAEIGMLLAIREDDGGHETVIGHMEERVQRDRRVFYRLENGAGEPQAGNIAAMPGEVERLKEGILRFSLATAEGERLLAAKIHTLPDNARVLVARDIGELSASYERLKTLSAVIMLLMLSVVVVSFGISHFVVSRINRIAATAEDIISTHDLSRRITVDTQWDDLSNLAQVLNRFLSQIETLMTSVREVSNNIAHDLRTPLAGLRSDIESLRGAPVEDRHLDALIAETDKIMRVFQSLLRITNIERGRRLRSFAEVDIAALLRDVMELYEPVAEEKHIAFIADIAPLPAVRGDADLLFQLFANLVDNAVKFSPPHGTLSIGARAAARGVEVVVADRGPGIPDSEKEHVFRHFYRGDASRSTEGNGLGLSLVKAVVEMHRGAITLEDGAPGLRVRIMLPPYE